MKKLFCMVALAAISFGSVFAAAPIHHAGTIQTDTTIKKKKMKMKSDTSKMKMKMKKDTTKKK
jgi:hypothetical protein